MKPKYEIVAHNFDETVYIPIGVYDDVEEAKKAIIEFDQNVMKIIFCSIMNIYSTHRFVDLTKYVRVNITQLDTGELLTLA